MPFRISACAGVAGYNLGLGVILNQKPARNEVERSPGAHKLKAFS